MKDRISEFYQEHKWLTVFGIAMLVLGILILCVGFWQTLLLAVLVAAGALIGALLDKGGWPAVKDFFTGLFARKE